MKQLLSTLTTFLSFTLVLGIAPALSTQAAPPAQANSRTFPETGKTVRGKFLEYWNAHGGLAQQGYPISDEFMEASDLDGKSYHIQYFERLVIELHPENGPPNDVLLSLLGRFRYNQKYPDSAPGQLSSTAADAVLFPETGMHLGGLFLEYWNAHGGLAQQGYPISEELTEISDLDGQPYTVQYFERAVFELHPENAPQYQVLLSHLGTFQYKARYASGAPESIVYPPEPTPTPTSTSTPTSTPRPPTPIIPTATKTPIPTATVAPARPTVAPVAPSGKVFALGDSVMLGGATELRRLVKSIEIDATVSRQVASGISVLKSRRDAGRLGDAVVIHLGNNGTFTTQQFDQIMQALAKVPKVIFVTIKVPRAWEGPDNAVIAAGVKRYHNAMLADWHAVSTNHPDYFAKDGYHLTAKGAKLYSELIAAALSK
ncbi:MAG TPA: hypothetical protein VJ183_05440 [Chloroflexia bacterium]|nr:hypothetical protein [Chloroflexia bacterium]